MNSISQVQTTDRNINQLQQNIAQAINPILANPLVYGNILSGIELAVGTNTIGTGLGRTCQGWLVVLLSGVASIYDGQATNQNADKTLILISSAAVTVSLYVF